jgi:hypothetical protein
MCYYATFLRLRRECHIQSLLETTRNLDQFLSTSDAIWPCSDQFTVLSFDVLGWGSTPYSPWVHQASNSSRCCTCSIVASLRYASCWYFYVWHDFVILVIITLAFLSINHCAASSVRTTTTTTITLYYYNHHHCYSLLLF